MSFAALRLLRTRMNTIAEHVEMWSFTTAAVLGLFTCPEIDTPRVNSGNVAATAASMSDRPDRSAEILETQQ